MNICESSKNKNTPNDKIKILDIIASIIFSIIILSFCIMYASSKYMNADTPFLTIMSIQKNTLFIWGQNRFLNIIPFLASPIKNPSYNLFLQLWMFGGSFILFLGFSGYAISKSIFKSSTRNDYWICYAVISFVFFTISSQYADHVFISEGQPYGPSCLLTALGILLLCGNKNFFQAKSFFAYLIIIIGTGLNPSLAILAAAAICFTLILQPEKRNRIFISCTIAFISCVFWLLIGRLFPGPQSYGNFSLHDALSNLEHSARSQMLGLSKQNFSFMMIGTACASAIFFRNNQVEFKRYMILCMFSACTCIFWFLLFSENNWVAINQWNFRYFYPITILLTLMVSVPFINIIRNLPRKFHTVITIALFFACTFILTAPWKPITNLPLFESVKKFSEVARINDIHFVAGSYWKVWPTIFLLSRDRTAFGMEEERAPTNRMAAIKELDFLIAQRKHPQALCLDADINRCINEAQLITGRLWQHAGNNCGIENCLIIELASH